VQQQEMMCAWQQQFFRAVDNMFLCLAPQRSNLRARLCGRFTPAGGAGRGTTHEPRVRCLSLLFAACIGRDWVISNPFAFGMLSRLAIAHCVLLCCGCCHL
jgi:hypothetical protein